MKGSLILALTVGLALAALPGPTSQTGSDRPSLSRSARGIVPPHQLFAADDADETLHFDTDPASGVGLTNGGTFWGGVRFTPTAGCTLKTILFYQWNSSNNDYVFVFGENNDTTPGAKLDSAPYNGADSLEWKVVNLTAPLVLPAGTDFWVAVRLNSAAGTFPLGVDAGPCVRNRGGFISSNGTRWRNLPDDNAQLDFNWNIRAVIASIPGLADDVGVTRVIAPETNLPVGSYAPACRIINFGTNPESDIPVTCWIDSGGVHIYSESMSYPGPLAPGGRADVTFSPNWNTGPAGNSYAISAFTTLGGDLNLANDTAHQTTTTAARFAVMDHDTGYCKLTVSCLGSVGYDAPQGTGNGFHYPKAASASALYYYSLAIGNDVTWVVDRYFSNPTDSPPNTDFVPTESLSAVVPPGTGDEHFQGAFNDAGHASPKGLTVTQHSYMNTAEGYDDFVILTYDIANAGSSPINGAYAGVFADFDVGTDSRANICYSDTAGRSMKMWMQGNQNPTVGLKILYPRSFANLTAMDHNIWVYPDSCVTENQKFRLLNGTIVQRRSNRAFDWTMVVSAGPFDLAPGGDAQRFAIAVIGAADTTTFQVNADSAQSWYDDYVGGIAEGPRPQTPVLRLGAAPNPFSDATQIRYSAQTAGRLELEAYDATGRLVDRMVIDVKAGVGVLSWRPQELGAGLYFLKVKTPDHESVIKALRTE